MEAMAGFLDFNRGIPECHVLGPYDLLHTVLGASETSLRHEESNKGQTFREEGLSHLGDSTLLDFGNKFWLCLCHVVRYNP